MEGGSAPIYASTLSRRAWRARRRRVWARIERFALVLAAGGAGVGAILLGRLSG